jgi:hypothetical protein
MRVQNQVVSLGFLTLCSGLRLAPPGTSLSCRRGPTMSQLLFDIPYCSTLMLDWQALFAMTEASLGEPFPGFLGMQGSSPYMERLPWYARSPLLRRFGEIL